MSAKVERAVTQTTQYLKVLNIPFEVEGTTLNIKSPAGKTVVIVLVSGAEAASQDTIQVSVEELAHRDSMVSQQAFAKITEAAGYGKPALVLPRAARPTKKLHYQDNFELVTMRHCEFYKVPNPPQEKYEEYKDVIKGASKSFYMRNKKYLSAHGMELEDCIQYAMVWATNYFGLYEVSSATIANRKGRLYNHLFQRFSELAKNLEKKGRSCIPSTATCRLGMGLDENETYSYTAEIDGDEQIDADYVARRNLIGNTKSAEARRKGAARLLSQLLDALPHDEMIEKLREVASSPHQNYFAQKEASRRLAKHAKQCSTCSIAALQEQE